MNREEKRPLQLQAGPLLPPASALVKYFTGFIRCAQGHAPRWPRWRGKGA